ncbi:MAG: PAS-domain containing protein, partial [Pseudomonadota bacterium]
MDLTQMLFVAAIAVLTAAFGLRLVVRPVRPSEGTSEPDTWAEDAALLFSGGELIDVSDQGIGALGITPETERWEDVQGSLAERFADLPTDLAELSQGERAAPARDPDDGARLILRREGDITRIRIEAGGTAPMERQAAENLRLRRALDTSPFPCWQFEGSGRVIWSNAAFDALRDELGTPLFTDLSAPKPGEARSRRVSITRPGSDDTRWFDVTQQRVADVTVNHAVNIAPVIQAEIAQRNFVQALAKTFAQLSIGLAIFDRAGQLALFNPALVDLTKLPAEFLSTRPDLASFFDRLRETRMMPEPKSYTSWRTQIASVIAAATDGRYQETWTLETGQTYRVSGRPHPDKAIAFLIEDISAEILLTRNFRAELEMGQSLLDSIADPIVVFSGTGILTFCNAGYRTLFGVEPENSFADVTIIDAVRDWQRIFAPNPEFSDIRDFVQDPGERAAWECRLQG